ncbi:hypothetical protein EIMP300_38770 [Escherichia coli]|uniref:Uncharacterized protein n=1 Tax=Escherichia coli TaxID=562 RepID=A0A8S0FQ71_ECOLX|nr:hypothetical protein EIMP300_38770 [Escherichia coli]
MKVKVLSLLVPALLVAGAANAAEVYNKDGNKLDLYGKVATFMTACTISLTTSQKTATRPTCVLASKVKLRLLTS